MWHVRDSNESDIEELKGNLRLEDSNELIASGHTSAEEGLRESYARSIVRLSVVLDGHVVAMFGVVCPSLLGTQANIWFLGSGQMSRIKKSFVRESRRHIRSWLNLWPLLWNIVDGRYVSAIRWLKSCGAKFHEAPLVLNGVPFYLFRIERA